MFGLYITVLYCRTEHTKQCETNWEQKYGNILWIKIFYLSWLLNANVYPGDGLVFNLVVDEL